MTYYTNSHVTVKDTAQSSTGRRRMRGVFERPPGSGVWWINYYDSDGVRHREKIGRESIAVEAYLHRRMEVKEGKFTTPRSVSRITFRDIAEERMATKGAILSPLSLRADKQRLPALLKVLGAVPARSITPQKAEEALARIGERGVSGATLNRYRGLLSNIFTVAVRNGRVRENPINKVSPRPEPPGRKRVLLAAEETKIRKRIRSVCAERLPEFDLVLNTGLRKAEQFNLAWSGIDLEKRSILVTGKGSPGKGPKQRFVPINEPAKKALLSLHRMSNGSAFVCPRKKREGQYDYSRWFEDLVEELKIPDLHWHDLRRTFASRLLMSGADIRTVQIILGHHSIETTMRYVHVSQPHLHAAVETLANWHQNGTKAKKTKRKIVQMPLNQSVGL